MPWLRATLPSAVSRSTYALVALATVAQVATVLVTRDLWRPRSAPPNLPVGGGDGWLLAADVDWAPVLVVLAVAVLAVPRLAAPGFCAALLLAGLGDQTRLQPEVVSLAVLMTAPLFGAGGTTIARFHLSSLWLWAGLHKALSLDWPTDGAGFITDLIGAEGLRGVLAWALPAVEVGLGAASLWPRAWPVARWVGAALHAGILLTLSPLLGDWNSAVWPWNAALAGASILLFRSEPVEWWAGLQHVAVRAGATVLLLFPALFYLGVVDAYLAHNLYSANAASAAICNVHRCAPLQFDTWSRLNVPLPPEPRLYRDWFDRVCPPDTWLEVTGPRTRLTDPPAVHRHGCPRSRGGP